MNSRLLSTSLLIAVIFCIGVNKSHATHAAGMEIFYRWTQDSTYEFTMSFYRNCVGFTAGAPASVNLTANSASASISQTVFLNRLPISGSGVPPLQPPNMYNCVVGTYCAEEYVYRGTWTSPKRAKDWIFSYQLCCLPTAQAPANMANGTLYNEAGLNNLDFPDTIHKNWSPIFHNRRPNHPGYLSDTVNNPAWISICAGRSIPLSQGTRNYDNDEVKYEFFVPQTNGGANNTYINGYSFATPMPTVGGALVIDSTTGMMNFVPGQPTATGIYLLGIKATEYRTDTVLVGGVPTAVKKEIGFVKRNLFIVIQDSATCPDSTFSFKDSSATASVSDIDLICDDNPFRVEFKRRVLCSSVDSNGSHILLINTTTQDTINIVKSYSQDCATNLTTNGFSVYLDSALIGGAYYLMFKQGTDGNTMLTDCYSEITPFADTLSVNVTPEPPTGLLIADTLIGNADTLELECHAQDFSVWLTEQFKCNSVKSDGSDFQLLNITSFPPTIEQISNANTTGACAGGASTQVNLSTSQLLTPGIYSLTLVHGNDGNSLVDFCYHNFDTSSLIIKVNDVFLNLGPDIVYCKNSAWDTIIGASVSWASYTWSTGSFSNMTIIDTAGTYWLKVFTHAGCFTTDTIEVFEKECYIGINESNSNSGIRIYPNPVSDNLYIEIDNFEKGMDLKVRSVNGQLINTISLLTPVQEIDVSNYQPGIYLVEILGTNGSITRKKIVVE